MTSINQMVYDQPGIITQVTGDLTNTRFLTATIFMYHYSNYCYAQLTRGTIDEETLQAKESYKCLTDNHGARVFSYR